MRGELTCTLYHFTTLHFYFCLSWNVDALNVDKIIMMKTIAFNSIGWHGKQKKAKYSCIVMGNTLC